MIQYPINVYPDNVTVDGTTDENDRKVHFTFKGDMLRAYVVRFFDYETGDVVVNDTPIYDYDSANYVFNNIGYNNDYVEANGLISSLTTSVLLTHSYVMQMMLVNGTVELSGDNADRFVLRGKVIEGCSAGETALIIEDKINSIYEWDLSVNNIRQPVKVTENQREYSLNKMFLVVNGERKLISSYNYSTGEITLDMGVTNAVADGTEYQIYSNYLVTEQYYFKTKGIPVLTNLYATFNARGIHFTGKCNDIVSYYVIKMQKKTTTGIYLDVAETEKIYSQLIQYDFCDDYDTEELDGGNDTTRKYRFIIDAVTQDGFNITATTGDFTAPERTNTDIIASCSLNKGKDSNYVFVSWGTVSGTTSRNCRVYRIDASNVYDGNKQLIADIDSSYAGFYDYTISKRGTYKYMIVPYNPATDSSEIDNAFLTDVIALNEYGYSLMAITDTDKNVDGKPFYLIDNKLTWTFLVDIENTTITQNLDNTLHVGYGRYSSTTSTNVNYLSGSISAYLGQTKCLGGETIFTDNIDIVRKWREFISRDCQYILQSPKGDALMVNITENPTTEYEENNPKLSTKFTFSWAECGSLNDIMVDGRIPSNAVDRD